jgi:Protein of unknown function (DUF433)
LRLRGHIDSTSTDTSPLDTANLQLTISAAHIVNLVANGMSNEEILAGLPDLALEDVRQAPRFAAMVAEDQVYPLLGSQA